MLNVIVTASAPRTDAAAACEMASNSVLPERHHRRADRAKFRYPYGDLSFRTKRYLEGRFDSCRSLLPGVHTGVIDLGALKTWALENAVDRSAADCRRDRGDRTDEWVADLLQP